jgi:hypothetical protein
MKFDINKEEEFISCYFISQLGMLNFRRIQYLEDNLKGYTNQTHNQYLLNAGNNYMLSLIPDNYLNYCSTKQNLLDFILPICANFLDKNTAGSSTNEEYATHCIMSDLINQNPKLFNGLSFRRNNTGAKNDFDLIDETVNIIQIHEHKYFTKTTDAGQTMQNVLDTIQSDEFYNKILELLTHTNNTITDIRLVPFWMFLHTIEDSNGKLRFSVVNKGKSFNAAKWQLSKKINVNLLQKINNPFDINEVKNILTDIYNYTKEYNENKPDNVTSVSKRNSKRNVREHFVLGDNYIPYYIFTKGKNKNKRAELFKTVSGNLCYKYDTEKMQTLNKKTVTEYYEWVKSLPNEIQQKIKLRTKETICERTILSLDKKRTIASLDTDGKIYDTRLFKNVIDDEFVKKLNEETYNKYKFILNKENHTIEVYIKNSYVGLLFETTERKSLRFVNSNDEEVLIHKCRNYANVA